MADGEDKADDDSNVGYKDLIFEQFQYQINVNQNCIHFICP